MESLALQKSYETPSEGTADIKRISLHTIVCDNNCRNQWITKTLSWLHSRGDHIWDGKGKFMISLFSRIPSCAHHLVTLDIFPSSLFAVFLFFLKKRTIKRLNMKTCCSLVLNWSTNNHWIFNAKQTFVSSEHTARSIGHADIIN